MYERRGLNQTRSVRVQDKLSGLNVKTDRFVNRTAVGLEAARRYLLPLVCCALPAILVTNYTLNHFYVDGGYFLDSGFFAFLTTHASAWPIQNPPAMGGTWFSFHFSPALYFLSAIHSTLFFWMPSPVYFSVIHGALFGCLSLAVWWLIGAWANSWIGIFALPLSLIAAFNGVALAAIGFPHIEIGIPAMLLLAVASYDRTKGVLFWSFLTFGLSLREDAGLHYFGVFFLLFLWSALPEKLSGAGKLRPDYLAIAIGCFAYAGFAIFLQRTLFFQDEWNLLRSVYFGSPPFAHITWTFLDDRIRASSFVLYVFAPLGLTIVLCLLRRDALAIIGFVSVVPWLLLSFLAPSFQAGVLRSYYSFPVVLGILWPAVAYRLKGERSYLIDLFLVAGLSSLLFITGAKWNHDNAPWTNFGLAWKGRIEINQRAAENLFGDHKPSGRFVVDDAVASLVPELVTKEHWKYGLAWGDEIPKIDTLIFQPGTWQDAERNTILARASLDRICRLGKSNFFVATRTAQNFPSCTPVQPVAR